MADTKDIPFSEGSKSEFFIFEGPPKTKKEKDIIASLNKELEDEGLDPITFEEG